MTCDEHGHVVRRLVGVQLGGIFWAQVRVAIRLQYQREGPRVGGERVIRLVQMPDVSDRLPEIDAG